MNEIWKWVFAHPLLTVEILAIAYLIDDYSVSISDAIKIRKSVRSFLKKPVEEDKLKLILELARLAPSASNRQEWRFVVKTNGSW